MSPQNGIAVLVDTITTDAYDIVRLRAALIKLRPTHTTMSSLFGLAEQVLSAASGGSSGARKTGGHEYNTPHHSQRPQGGYDTSEVLSHADTDEEGKGYIENAIRHVHDNPQRHQEQLDEGDLSKYGPLIISAISSVASKSGISVGTLMSGGLGEGGGNQLMGLVMKEAGKSFGGGGSSEEKQSVMNGAAMTLAKVVAQKQLSAFTGGSNSGGLSMLGIGETLLKSRFG